MPLVHRPVRSELRPHRLVTPPSMLSVEGGVLRPFGSLGGVLSASRCANRTFSTRSLTRSVWLRAPLSARGTTTKPPSSLGESAPQGGVPLREVLLSELRENLDGTEGKRGDLPGIAGDSRGAIAKGR